MSDTETTTMVETAGAEAPQAEQQPAAVATPETPAQPAAPVLEPIKGISRDVMETCVVLEISFSRMTNSRKGNLAAVETDANKGMLKLSKKLFISKEWDAIESVIRQCKGMLRDNSVQTDFAVGGGRYVLQLDRVNTVEGQLLMYREFIQQAVETFIAVYEQRCNESMAELASQSNARDYPTVSQVRKRFGMDWKYLAFETPQRLRRHNQALWERQVTEAKAELGGAVNAALAEVIDFLAEKLSPSEDGKKKVIQARRYEDCRATLEMLASFTPGSDTEPLVTRARALLDGTDPKALNKEGDARAVALREVEAMKAALGALVTSAPTRRVFLED